MSLLRLLARPLVRDTGFISAPFIRNLGGSVPLNLVQDQGAFWMEATDDTLLLNAIQAEITVSFWLRLPDPSGTVNWTFLDGSTSARQLQVKIGGTGRNLLWDFRTYLGAQIGTGNVTDALDFDTDHHIMFSIATSATADRWDMFVDGVSIGGGTVGANGVQPFEYWFQTDDGAAYDGGFVGVNDQAAEFGHLWIGSEYVSDPTGVFRTASGGRIDGGSDGSQYTGTQPEVYLGSDATAWNAGTNSGTGGNFTVSGTVA